MHGSDAPQLLSAGSTKHRHEGSPRLTTSCFGRHFVRFHAGWGVHIPITTSLPASHAHTSRHQCRLPLIPHYHGCPPTTEQDKPVWCGYDLVPWENRRQAVPGSGRAGILGYLTIISWSSFHLCRRVDPITTKAGPLPSSGSAGGRQPLSVGTVFELAQLRQPHDRV